MFSISEWVRVSSSVKGCLSGWYSSDIVPPLFAISLSDSDLISKVKMNLDLR